MAEKIVSFQNHVHLVGFDEPITERSIEQILDSEVIKNLKNDFSRKILSKRIRLRLINLNN